jgi:hypothetical protein
VNGTLEAMNARVEFMGAAGFVVAQTATIAAAPKDLRNGFFDNPFSPTSCLLDVRRNAPADLRYCVFEKSERRRTHSTCAARPARRSTSRTGRARSRARRRTTTPRTS